MSTENLGGQFKGWFNPASQGAEGRPERTGEGLEKPDYNPRDVIAQELDNHPKKVGLDTFLTGLNSMGIKADHPNLHKIAGLIKSNNNQFHQLVSMARKNAFGQRQQMATIKNRKRSEAKQQRKAAKKENNPWL